MTLVALTIILMVAPENLNPFRRRCLLIARMTAAFVLMVACFRPSLVRTDQRPADATLMVALDTSRSMTLADSDKASRLETQIASAKRLLNGLAELDETLTVKWFAYDSLARELGLSSSGRKSDGAFLDTISAEGKSTDLSAAAMASITLAEGQPIAGVVMFGDGTQTAAAQGGGASRVVRTLNSIGVPLWAVPIGPAAGETATRDVAVSALRESYQMFSGNEVEIAFQVSAQGLAARDLPLRLLLEDETGAKEEIATRTARPEQANDTISVIIPIVAPKPGVYRLIASADIQDGETVTTNNEQVAFVEVREGGGRVFYLEGSLRQEYVFLRRALRRFPDLDLTARWIPRDTRANWPVDLSDHFRPGKYDIYILGDLPADAIGNIQLDQLAKAVDAGAGLLLLGGPNAFSQGGYAETPIVDVAPIEMGRPDGDSQGDDRRIGLLPTHVHPITRLDREFATETWSDLPNQLGANQWASVKVAPGVDVILEDDRQQPMMVLGGFGKGRVTAVAFDSTWRWWRSGKSSLHRKFWRQTMLWLLSREDTADDQIIVELDSQRFDSSDPPGFTARARERLDAGTAPSLDLFAQIVRSDGGLQAIENTISKGANPTDGQASLRGRIPQDLTPGSYRLRVSSRKEDLKLGVGEVPFQVIDQSIEMSRPTADPVFLTQLAEQTADQGGRAFRPDQVDALIRTIAKRRKKAETPVVEKARLGDGPRTGWPLFLVFAVALSIEWYLRRRWNLA